jgi:hypothetical protein
LLFMLCSGVALAEDDGRFARQFMVGSNT